MLTDKGVIFFNLLADRFHKDGPDDLWQLISKPQTVPYTVKAVDPALMLSRSWSRFYHVHYSWLPELLEKIPIPFRAGVISVLSEAQQKGVAAAEKSPARSQTYTVSIKRFLEQVLLTHWDGKDIVARELLPELPLSSLTTASKQTLIDLIDLLAMHDVADEMRKIVDKTTLSAINECLSPAQRDYLKLYLHQKIGLGLPPLNVQRLTKDPENFHVVLHKRGIQHIALALSGSPLDFVWHISHTLDKGRGTLLMQRYQKQAISNSTPIATQEVLQALQFLKRKQSNPEAS